MIEKMNNYVLTSNDKVESIIVPSYNLDEVKLYVLDNFCHREGSSIVIHCGDKYLGVYFSGNWINAVPELGSIWYNIKSNNPYNVLSIANIEAHQSPRNYPITIVYIDKKGRVWAKSLERWHQSMIQNSR